MESGDKRRAHRLSIQLPARFKGSDEQINYSDAFVMNINAKGLCFAVRQEFEVGQEIEFQIELSPDEKVVIQTKVIWVRETAMAGEYMTGVQIIDALQPDAAKFVRFYAKKLLSMTEQEIKGGQEDL